jgi:DNA polymerase-3 subunit chi
MADRVDFYVLESAAPKPRWTVACRLTEKAYLRDLRVLILSGSLEEAKAVDELLWTFNDRSFIPHRLSEPGSSMDPQTPVHLFHTELPNGGAELANGGADLLVNLSDRLPPALDRMGRIAEIIDADPQRRRLGRERFKSYREQKLTLETHQLNDTQEF